MIFLLNVILVDGNLLVDWFLVGPVQCFFNKKCACFYKPCRTESRKLNKEITSDIYFIITLIGYVLPDCKIFD